MLLKYHNSVAIWTRRLETCSSCEKSRWHAFWIHFLYSVLWSIPTAPERSLTWDKIFWYSHIYTPIVSETPPTLKMVMELEETVQVVQGRNKLFLIKSLIIEEDKRDFPSDRFRNSTDTQQGSRCRERTWHGQEPVKRMWVALNLLPYVVQLLYFPPASSWDLSMFSCKSECQKQSKAKQKAKSKAKEKKKRVLKLWDSISCTWIETRSPMTLRATKPYFFAEPS